MDLDDISIELPEKNERGNEVRLFLLEGEKPESLIVGMTVPDWLHDNERVLIWMLERALENLKRDNKEWTQLS